jgi:hypothetical protein
MLIVTVDYNFKIHSGNAVVNGTVNTDLVSIEWTYAGENAYTSEGTSINGRNWEINVNLTSNNTEVEIRAVDGSDYSNIETVLLNSISTDPLESSWTNNEVDELGYENDLYRFPNEGNVSFNNRVEDVGKNPGGSSLLRLVKGITRELGYPHMDNFFSIGVRWDPRTGDIYKKAWVNFDLHKISFQSEADYVTSELLELEESTQSAPLVYDIGSEYSIDGVTIKIYNGGKQLSPDHWTILDNGRVWIDYKYDKFNPDLVTTASYPKKHTMYYDGKTVTDVKTWLEGLETVVDEFSNVVPLVVWYDGILERVVEIPNGEPHSERETIEQATNETPATNYYKITGNLEDEIYEYVNLYPVKANFKASQIFPVGPLSLGSVLSTIPGTWIIINRLFDKDFIDTLKTDDTNRQDVNLRDYMERLREATRMGIGSTLVNHDYWRSDAPEVIGDNFLPARYDAAKGTYPVITPQGFTQQISLNTRRHYAKKLTLTKK